MSERINRVGRVCAPLTVDFLSRPVRPLGPDEVLIHIRASAICGSDLHIFKGKHPSAPLPCTIGHEFSGDVEAVGEQVTAIRPGQRVTVEPCVVCGTCDACRHGDYGYCEHISYTYRMGDGAMADFIVVRAPYVYPLPEGLGYEEGALIEPLSVAVHAVRRANIQMGETVLVIGAGAIGMLVAALCRRRGAGEVIISDMSDARLAMAKALGATTAVNVAQTDLEAYIAEHTHGKGVQKSFECVGCQATFLQAMNTLCRNGTATVVGIYENPQITIPASRFVTHEIHVQGSQGYCWDFPVALKLAGELPLQKLVTHVFPLEQLQAALETCLDREKGAVKVILKP